MTAVMGDGGVANAVLTGRTDGCDPEVRTQARAQLLVACLASRACNVSCGFQAHFTVVDDQHRKFRRAPDEDDGVTAAAFAGDGKAAAGERVVDAIGQW